MPNYEGNYRDELLVAQNKQKRLRIIGLLVVVAYLAMVGSIFILPSVPENFGSILGGATFIFFVFTFYMVIRVNKLEKDIKFYKECLTYEKVKSIVPESCKTMVTYIGANTCYGLRKNTSYYIWKSAGKINFYPVDLRNKDSGYELKNIPLNEILFYEPVGERYHETKITGGGGNKVSVAGAIVGNALGGTAGAVLLGSKGAKPVKSKDVVHDNRSVGVKLANQQVLYFAFGDLSTFKLVIPDKDASTLSQNTVDSGKSTSDIIPVVEEKAVPVPQSTNTQQEKVIESTNSLSVADEIMKFKKLCDDGIITAEEFEKKKKQLLEL